MRILIVEDDINIANNLAEYLEQNTYAMDIANDGEQGLIFAQRENTYDAIILDINLPLMDGLTLCKTLRTRGISTPILMLTARDTLDDKIQGLQIGADDYLVKPFSLREVLARIQALIRRKYDLTSTENTLSCDDLLMDEKAKKVTISGKAIRLTKKEYQILQLLLTRKDDIVSKQEIQNHIRGNNADLRSDVVRTHIKGLRSKIDKHARKRLIYNVRGMGYILTANPTKYEDE